MKRMPTEMFFFMQTYFKLRGLASGVTFDILTLHAFGAGTIRARVNNVTMLPCSGLHIRMPIMDKMALYAKEAIEEYEAK